MIVYSSAALYSHSLYLTDKQNTNAEEFLLQLDNFSVKISNTARISQLIVFSINQVNLHRYNTTTHNKKRMKLRYLADSELLKLTAQERTRSRDSHGCHARSAVTFWRRLCHFYTFNFRHIINNIPSGFRASVVTHRTAWTCGKLYSVFVKYTHKVKWLYLINVTLHYYSFWNIIKPTHYSVVLNFKHTPAYCTHCCNLKDGLNTSP